MSNNSRRRAAAHRSGAPRQHRPKQGRSSGGGQIALRSVLLLALPLLALVGLTAAYNAYRATPPPEELPDHVVINEVCAADQTLLTAPDGYRHGWVELYNPTPGKVSLYGWGLSNKKTDLRRFSFPEGTELESGGRMLVWWTGSLSAEPLSTMEKSGVPFAAHTLLRGDTLCLSREGVVVDVVEVPSNLHQNTSYGRTEDGGLTFSPMEPTPEESNEGARLYAAVEQPTFSVPSGFYDKAFELSIEAPEGCSVYYTLDSSVPTAESTPYTAPITVEDATPNPNVYCLNQEMGLFDDKPLFEGQQPMENGYYSTHRIPTENVDKCTVVRAVAVDADGNESDPVTASYFVGFADRAAYQNLGVLSLVSDPDGLFGDWGIMVAGKTYKKQLADGTITTRKYWGNLRTVCNFFLKGSAWERSVHIDCFDEDKELSFSQEAGLRCHGNASRRRVPKSLGLYAREGYDGNELFQQPLFDSSTLTDKVYLVNGAAIRRYSLISRMDDRAMDTQDYRLVQVFLDGEYWGFYALQEPYNSDAYITDHYGLSNDSTILLKTDSVKLVNVTGSQSEIEEEYQPLVDFAAGHDLSKEKNWEKLNRMMDVQSFIDYYASNIYICNRDINWHQNLFLLKTRKVRSGNPYADGRWHWILFDMDYSSGYTADTPVDYDMFRGTFLNQKHSLAADPLFPHLMKNRHFREMFVRTFLDMGNEVFGAEEMTAVAEDLKEHWSEAAFAHVLRYPAAADATSLNRETHASRFQGTCDKMAEFFQGRFDYAVPQMADYFGLTGKRVTVTLQGAEGGTVTLNTITPDLSGGDWQGIYYTDVPVVLRANPEPGQKLDHWELSSGSVSEDENGDTLLKLKGDVTVRPVFTVDDSPAESDSGSEVSSS